jgi:hypothetical protein
MSALPPDDMRNLRHPAFEARHPAHAMAARWQAIADHSARLAVMAQLHSGANAGTPPIFSGALEDTSDWQRELAWQGLEDILAMLQAGMAALDVLEMRGVDPRVPALALWREVDIAQRSVLAMLGMAATTPAPSAATA